VRILLQLIERAPDAETKIPRLCSSLETRTWPKAGYSRAKAVIAAFAAILDIELKPIRINQSLNAARFHDNLI